MPWMLEMPTTVIDTQEPGQPAKALKDSAIVRTFLPSTVFAKDFLAQHKVN